MLVANYESLAGTIVSLRRQSGGNRHYHLSNVLYVNLVYRVAMNSAFISRSVFVLTFLFTVELYALAQDNPRHIDLPTEIDSLKTLEQNWSDETSNWFYNVPQGSRLIPYIWFLNLEQAGSETLFRDAAHFRKLGYIPRKPDPRNPDGLPIGFISDAPYEDKTPSLGITCAACHTSQINVGRTAYLIDGGPTMGDFEQLLKELTEALKATLNDDNKFDRFASKVLPASSATDLAALRKRVKEVANQREGYNQRNLPKAPEQRFGHGRVDAFGAIFNEVSVTFLGIPGNQQPANAPVSYPCLWDAPQHDRVQWNGAAENKVTPLGNKLFGTAEVGALGRNAGEVLGVFGSVHVNDLDIPLNPKYPSTVNREHLIEIENSLKTLWSPEWPKVVLGPIDPVLSAKGAALFKENCSSCHKSIDRTDPDRKVIAKLSTDGTDPTLNVNFRRLAQTGKLEGRRKTLLGLERFAKTEPVAVILKHVVERSIVQLSISLEDIKSVLVSGAISVNPEDVRDALNPGYRMTATIVSGDKKLVGQFDSLGIEGPTLTIGGGMFNLMEKGRDVLTKGLGHDLIDLRNIGSLEAVTARLKEDLLTDVTPLISAVGEQTKVKIQGEVEVGYKARPLNGVWATAPYLHNGSIPNLAELLKSPKNRVKSFRIGSLEYDDVNLGLKDDPNYPLFDTSVVGNSNAGHD